MTTQHVTSHEVYGVQIADKMLDQELTRLREDLEEEQEEVAEDKVTFLDAVEVLEVANMI